MKKIRKVAAVIVFVIFSFCNISYSADDEAIKAETKKYIERVNPVLADVDTTYRNVSMKVFPLKKGAKNMQGYINALNSITPPEAMKKQHRMILLAFKKLRMAYYLLSDGDRETSLPLVKKVSELLRLAVKDIKDFVQREGLVNTDRETEDDKERSAR
ncbi:hypothetical protein ACFL2G_01650 [Candidatus Omnitrophota bacterium]